ncbi:hypothetical protein ACTXT7_008573, partial [Hymenolepis weldensis]
CDPDCKTVYMAHALRRISYATCDPFTSKFAFLAREANSETPCQYCHIFATDTQFQLTSGSRSDHGQVCGLRSIDLPTCLALAGESLPVPLWEVIVHSPRYLLALSTDDIMK